MKVLLEKVRFILPVHVELTPAFLDYLHYAAMADFTDGFHNKHARNMERAEPVGDAGVTRVLSGKNRGAYRYKRKDLNMDMILQGGSAEEALAEVEGLVVAKRARCSRRARGMASSSTAKVSDDVENESDADIDA